MPRRNANAVRDTSRWRNDRQSAEFIIPADEVVARTRPRITGYVGRTVARNTMEILSKRILNNPRLAEAGWSQPVKEPPLLRYRGLFASEIVGKHDPRLHRVRRNEPTATESLWLPTARLDVAVKHNFPFLVLYVHDIEAENAPGGHTAAREKGAVEREFGPDTNGVSLYEDGAPLYQIDLLKFGQCDMAALEEVSRELSPGAPAEVEFNSVKVIPARNPQH